MSVASSTLTGWESARADLDSRTRALHADQSWIDEEFTALVRAGWPERPDARQRPDPAGPSPRRVHRAASGPLAVPETARRAQPIQGRQRGPPAAL